MEKTFNKKWAWAIAPSITVLGLLVLYFVKGIYPFGTGTVIGADLLQGGMPALFYMYDALHGGNLFYDLTTAGGLERDMLTALFYPTNLFMLFFKRESLIHATSYLVIFKFATISFTSSYAFSKIYTNLSSFWTIAVSVIYTFCGYNLEYYTNLDWLDTVALYPLLVLALLNMFQGKSKIPYFLIMTYLLTFHTYMAFFVIVSLVVFGGLYIFIVECKENRKKDVYALGIGTFAALLASAYALFENLKSIFGTARFDMNATLSGGQADDSFIQSYVNILKVENTYDIVSFFLLLSLELAFASLVLLWIKSIKNKPVRKPTIFFTLCIGLLVLQLVITSIDLLWHGGSRVMFPMRNGYMLGFFGCLTIGYYFVHFNGTDGIRFKKNIYNIIAAMLCIFAAGFVIPNLSLFKQCFDDFHVLSYDGMIAKSLLYPYFSMAIKICLLFLLFKIISHKHIRNTLTAALVTVCIGINAFLLIGNAENSPKAQMFDSLYADCFDVGEHANGDALSRINNPDLSLTMNYAYLAQTHSISNWTHSLSSSQLQSFHDLGVSTYYTAVFDAGGTAFSKALLRVTETVSKDEVNETLYTPICVSDRGLRYYTNNFVLPVGVLCSADIADLHFNDFENTFTYQNAIYNSISGDAALFERANVLSVSEETNTDTFTYLDVVETETDVCQSKITLDISGQKIVYLTTKDGITISDITVNGNRLPISDQLTFGGKIQYTFPTYHNNNVLELGSFQEDTVTLEMKIQGGSFQDINLYTMDMEKLEKLCQTQPDTPYTVQPDGTITLTAHSATAGSILFIPITYSSQWECEINGTAVEPVCLLGNFIGLETVAGDNQIQLSFSHRNGYIQIASVFLLTAVGIAILLLEKRIRSTASMLTLLLVAFASIFALCVTVLYVTPIVFKVVHLLM